MVGRRLNFSPIEAVNSFCMSLWLVCARRLCYRLVSVSSRGPVSLVCIGSLRDSLAWYASCVSSTVYRPFRIWASNMRVLVLLCIHVALSPSSNSIVYLSFVRVHTEISLVDLKSGMYHTSLSVKLPSLTIPVPIAGTRVPLAMQTERSVCQRFIVVKSERFPKSVLRCPNL
jgi:hypothetical protein